MNYNLSDLKDKIKWAHENPKLASQIANHASETIKQSIRNQDLQCYMYRLLLEYQELFI